MLGLLGGASGSRSRYGFKGSGFWDTNLFVDWHHCRLNIAHARQSSPDSSLGFLTKVLAPFEIVPSLLKIGVFGAEVQVCCLVWEVGFGVLGLTVDVNGLGFRVKGFP